jgi:hypothetical protein
VPDASSPPRRDERHAVTPVSNPGAPRAEREHVEFPDIAWTAFDRYARYGGIVRAISANLGPGAHRALDVGDNAGYLHAFAPDLTVTSVDVAVNEKPLAGTHLVVADGSRLPVADRSVDVVVSCDALEHVPPPHRAAFLAELARCARDLIVVAAPFDTPGVAGSEELVRRFVDAATGSPQAQLAEHAEHGLPSLTATREVMVAQGFSVTEVGNGNLQDWVLGMLVKHQVVGRGGFLDLDIGFDVFYNMALQNRSDVGPFYRHILIGRRSQAPATGVPAPPADPGLDATLLLSALLTVAPGTTGVLEAVAAIQSQQAEAFTHLMSRFAGVDAALQHLMQRFDGTDAALQLLIAEGDARSAAAAQEAAAREASARGPLRRAWRLLRRS